MKLMMCCIVCIIFVVMLLCFLFTKQKKRKRDKFQPLKIYDKYLSIYNALPYNKIQVDIYNSGLPIESLQIPKLESRTFPLDLKKGMVFKIYLIKKKDNEEELVRFYDYIVKKYLNTLYVGQVTTKLDPKEVQPLPVNGVNGMQRIWVHNKTYIPISFNNNICVKPKNTYKYTGRYATAGVPIGLTLRNREGIFEPLLLNQKTSDIYFGVTSDIKQPLFHGYKTTPLDLVDDAFCCLGKKNCEPIYDGE